MRHRTIVTSLLCASAVIALVACKKKGPDGVAECDEAKKVVHLAEAVPPCKADPCPVYEPLQRAAYVVELNAGQARREKAVTGASLSFDLPQR